MLSTKKKVIILSFMVVLLVATGVVNVLLNRDPADGSEPPPVGGQEYGDFFEGFRAERTAGREEQKELQLLIKNDPASTAEEIAVANAELAAIASRIEVELALEWMIIGQGFGDCVVTMSTNNINVMVDKAVLTETEVAQILFAVVEQTDADPTQVKVIPVREKETEGGEPTGETGGEPEGETGGETET